MTGRVIGVWVGVNPSGLSALTEDLERYAGHAAQQLADAMADSLDTVPCELEAYVRTRAAARRARALHDRCYGPDSIGRFAGYLIREGSYKGMPEPTVELCSCGLPAEHLRAEMFGDEWPCLVPAAVAP
jgi:hypothetical protein